MIKVSVIVPAESFNENLERCLEALKKQTFKNFEIIVVSDKFSGSPSRKRNWGARRARGEILAFLDDDCIADKSWIKNGVGVLETGAETAPLQGAVAGPMLTPLNSPFWERIGGYLCESPLVFGDEVYRNKISSKREVSDYPSANFFIKKKDFLKLGGFDERFWPGEDTKLCLEIVRRGGKILYDPLVLVYHRRRPLFRPCTRRHMASPFLEQAARYGRQRGKFVRLFPQTSRKIGYFLPSLLVIFLILCLIFWRWGIVLYLAGVILEGVRVMVKEKNLFMGPVFMIGVFLTHVVYGISFLGGLSYLGNKKI